MHNNYDNIVNRNDSNAVGSSNGGDGGIVDASGTAVAIVTPGMPTMMRTPMLIMILAIQVAITIATTTTATIACRPYKQQQ